MGQVLPTRAAADDMMQVYWSKIHPIFPFVHKPSFEADYLKLWTPGRAATPRLFHCKMNAMFALSCRMILKMPPKTGEEQSMSYFDRARRLLKFEVVAPPSLDTVQALLLVAQYCQSIGNHSGCWTVLGTAVCTAQTLGIRQEISQTLGGTQCQEEMFRRLWHGCLLLRQ